MNDSQGTRNLHRRLGRRLPWIAWLAGTCIIPILERGARAEVEAAGRKAPEIRMNCDRVGQTLRCESEDLKFEIAPPGYAGLPKASGRELRDAFAKGYERGLLEAATLKDEFRDAEHYVWRRPLVQKIWVPPMIVSGVFVPGHQEFVILKPAEWQLINEKEEQ